MNIRVVAITAVLAALAGLLLAQPAEFQVIVNVENPTTRLSTEQLTHLFLNRGVRWAHGAEVVSVDQSARSPVREIFTRRVMGKTVDAVVNHWKQRMITEREAPPQAKGSDADVIEFVTKHKGAVGYVSPGVSLPATVKAIVVKD